MNRMIRGTFNKSGRSAFSVLSAVVVGVAFLVSCNKEPVTAPLPDLARPINVSVVPRADTAMEVRWTDVSELEEGYAVERRVNAGPFVELARTPANQEVYVDMGSFRSDTTYQYRIRAFAGERTSPYTDSVFILFVHVLPRPTNLSFSRLSDSSVKIQWVHISSMETGFSIERAVEEDQFTEIATVGADQLEYTDYTYTAGFIHAYRVRAFSAANRGEPSNSVPVFNIPEDLFPLVEGRRLEYSGYMTSYDTETKIEASVPGYAAQWKVGPVTSINSVYPNPPTNISGTGVLVSDSSHVPGVGIDLSKPLFFSFDASTGEYRMLVHFGYLFRTFAVNRSDSLRYIGIARPRMGILSQFTSFDETFQGLVSGIPVYIQVRYLGMCLGVDSVETSVGTLRAWRYEIEMILSIGGTPVAVAVPFKFWFTKGIGPVQMFIGGDAEHHGHFRTLSGKNF